MKKRIYINKWNLLIAFCVLAFASCSDVLDKKDLSAINEEDVWVDEDLTESFLNEIYDDNLDGWPINASATSDDASGQGGAIYGELTANSNGIYAGLYRNIKDINLFLEKVGEGELASKTLFMAQAHFFRAKAYFDLVSTYGGVPLVLKVPVQGVDELEVPRNRTSECITQIISDLDTAINGLPNVYDDSSSDYGRITKGAAMAFKAKVLITYASEQFDPNQSAGRWQAAYDAISAAKTNLEANGKGLHPDFENFWFDESNSNVEAIIIRRFNVDRTQNRDAGCRPFVVGTNGESWDKPTISILEAFPMKDGKAITDGTSSYTYDSGAFWLNRDPRFEATIAHNGAMWDLNDPEPQKTSALHWAFQESRIEAQSDSRISPSALYCRKAVNVSVAGGNPTLLNTTDWIEMRYTEVLLFAAEAANEIGNTSEAYDALIAIRQRAGIDAGGDNMYGLQAGMDQDQMRDAIFLERRIELTYEGKRSSDLRRRRMYGMLNGMHRKGYVIERTAAFDALDPSDEILDDRIALEEGILDGSIDINDPTVYNTYFDTQVRSLERDGNTTEDGTPINYQDNYYFFDLPQSAMDKNPSLVQTEGWPGGSFNPLD